jgi:putative restriction endonuclease
VAAGLGAKGGSLVKGVFEVSGLSRYDDLITERYHFPNDYLRVAKQLVGDWIVYRETRAAGGRMAYVAVAFVDRIDPDPADRSHFYARVSQFLELDRPVPYRDQNGAFAERFLREMASPADAGRTLRGASVRILEGDDFAAIISQGLDSTLSLPNRQRLQLDPEHLDRQTELLLAEPLTKRRIEQVLMNRKIRDANFRGHVLDAYDSTCAVTGLKIVNGGGRAEAQAAHIWSVEHGGPDIVQNGLALSATAHWLFDRHLISLDSDFRLLISHNSIPNELSQLFPPSGEPIRLPANANLRPNPAYVAKHRDLFSSKRL